MKSKSWTSASPSWTSSFSAMPCFANWGSDEQSRMRRQLDVMREYAVILGERISAF